MAERRGVRVRVDATICQGTGYCERVAPAVFVVVDGSATVLVSDPDPDLVEAVDEAERLCPSRAITW